MVATLPYSFAAYGTMSTISLGISGSLLAATSLAAHMVLDLLTPPQHDMSNYVLPESQCEGGRL